MSSESWTAELQRYGPHAGSHVSLSEARAYCRRLARRHYENFTVASWLLPAALRPHFYHVYAYCRWADDLADEISDPRQSLDMLSWWRQELLDCYAGRAWHPVFVALAETIDEFAIPVEPFLDLLVAFERDQRQTRYESVDDVLDYCRCSANPVGRLVLYLGRCHTPANAAWSDAICSGLQLANFCQDVARDFQGGRFYLPLDCCREAGYSESMFGQHNPAFRRLMINQVDLADSLLQRGQPLVAAVPRSLRIDVELFLRGGQAILQAIRRQDYNVWSRRPTVGKLCKMRLLAAAWWKHRHGTDAAGTSSRPAGDRP